MKICTLLLLSFMLLTACRINSGNRNAAENWSVYGGNDGNNHYSTLKQIDTSNVQKLKIAWVYRPGDADSMSQMEVNPLIINGILYGVSPHLKLFALDAVSGRAKWTFDPQHHLINAGKEKGPLALNVCRGVAYYSSGDKDNRIFYTAGSYLFCIDAFTGTPVKSFGQDGSLDLHENLGRDAKDLYVTSTSPGVIYKELIIIGTRVSEESPAAPGDIRAYDVHTGKLRWSFHTIPHPGEFGYESWKDKNAYTTAGGANSWSGFTLDRQRGTLYASTGSAVYDFYGGSRIGDDLFANCVLAIDAATGKRIWHFQTAHHDVWDRDLPNAPILVDLQKNHKKTEAMVQLTKTGFVFVFDRITGKPLFPVKEKRVPTHSELAGEILSPTQPVPVWPKPFVRQHLSASDLNRWVPDSSYRVIKQQLDAYEASSMFSPPTRKGTVIFPGFDGGAEWGGGAVDPESKILYVNANDIPWVLTMIDAKKAEGKTEKQTTTNMQKGAAVYRANCIACHGVDRKGSGNYPSIVKAGQKYSLDEFKNLVSSGRRMMPAFSQLSEPEKTALASYILQIKHLQNQKFTDHHSENKVAELQPFTSTGYHKFQTPEGYPAVTPPWGTLTAIDLNTGNMVWRDTLGDEPAFKAKGIHTGTENYGGPVITAGGLLFIAATKDGMFRAFNKRTGRLLWETKLPAAGFATPAVYEADGKQYVVIACGGGKLNTPSSDAYIAFSL